MPNFQKGNGQCEVLIINELGTYPLDNHFCEISRQSMPHASMKGPRQSMNAGHGEASFARSSANDTSIYYHQESSSESMPIS